MKTEEPCAKRLEDYREPAYLVDSIDLDIDLDPDTTRVTTILCIRPHKAGGTPLVLDGTHIELEEVRLNGRVLNADQYQHTPTHLRIPDVPDTPFNLSVVSFCQPRSNTALSGLYFANDIFCTQCEAEGFRRLAYAIDRPDVMSVYSVRITAPVDLAPVMLSNGNCIGEGTLDDGRHFVQWHDPFPKPTYLFALVAGNLACVRDTFTTLSGREVALRFYVEPGNENRCTYAMNALKRAMKWDEEVFGREYDLDIFMIAAVSAFNMGAMENKGLNIFNDKYVLASPDTATDADYANIESIIAHEYFHNWTGNRITCRDWFQLCLKEGLTVFRDQEFSSDMRSRPVKRINDVQMLRAHQFSEDESPLAHPVRPDSYIEINNFYTATVYEKGAELVRMIHRLAGAQRFRKGMELYFERHDGQAVRVEELLACLSEGAGLDLTLFRRWYEQAGTPEIRAEGSWDAEKKEYRLALHQHTPPTPGQPHKKPLHIPVEVGLVVEGKDLDVTLENSGKTATSHVLELREQAHTFRFTNVHEKPVPSVLRGFTAPVNLVTDLTQRDQAFLMVHDTDPFNRWEACQRYSCAILIAIVKAIQNGKEPDAGSLTDMMCRLLPQDDLEPEFIAQMLSLPGEAVLARMISQDVDPDAIHQAREWLRKKTGQQGRKVLMHTYERLTKNTPYAPHAADAGRRRLRNLCLDYLAAGDPGAGSDLARTHYDAATNMTDTVAALGVLAGFEGAAREDALSGFYERWKNNHLVMDKWLSIQATSCLPDTLSRVRSLTQHPVFSMTNPNKVRALIGAFAAGNQVRFHGPGGYAFVADSVITLDTINPQLAARILTAFKSWRIFSADRRTQLQQELERVARTQNLSRDVFEITRKILA